MVLAYTSQPRLSRPKMWPGPGPWRAVDSSQVFASNGSIEVNSDGQNDMTSRTAIRTSEMMNIGLRRRSYQASLQRLAGLASFFFLGLAGGGSPGAWFSFDGRVLGNAGPTRPNCGVSLIADPRVEHGVQHVDDQVCHDVHQHQDCHDTYDDGLLAQVNALE